MSKISELPIYKLTYDVLLQIMHITHHFPREYKYTLGEKIQVEIIELMVCIYRIYTQKYEEMFYKLNEHAEILFLYLRISHDMKLLSLEKYGEIIEKINNVLKQAKGWQYAIHNKAGTE